MHRPYNNPAGISFIFAFVLSLLPLTVFTHTTLAAFCYTLVLFAICASVLLLYSKTTWPNTQKKVRHLAQQSRSLATSPLMRTS